MARAARAGTGALALVALYDELWSGIAVVAASDVERVFGIGHARYTLLVFAVPLLLAALIEAPIALRSDRVPRRRVLAGGLGALSAALALCALSEHGWSLSLGLALAGAASGVACGAAQAELVEARPEHAERALNRWTAFAAAGDVLAPLLVAAIAYCGGSHRVALALIAAVTALHAWRAHRTPTAPAESSPGNVRDEPAASWREGLALAGRPRLWLMLFAAACCALLDEIVVALAALRLHEARCSPSLAAATLAAYSVGGFAGALGAERALLAASAQRVLLVSALLSLGALALFIAAPSQLVAVIALLVLGAAAAPHHPLAQAAAYQLVPGRPGLVQALGQAFVVLDALMPLAIGALASAYGVNAALAALALQPLVMLVVALGPGSTP